MMNKFDGQKLVELIGLEANNEKVLNTFEALGLEIPPFSEEFEMEGRVWTDGEDKSGIAIEFVEDNNKTGDPIIEQIDFYDEQKVSFPLGLHKNDDFETVVQKIGRKPDFCNKRLPSSKQWVFPRGDKEIVYAIHFKPDMKSINTIVVTEFNRPRVEVNEFIFPCEELEE